MVVAGRWIATSSSPAGRPAAPPASRSSPRRHPPSLACWIEHPTSTGAWPLQRQSCASTTSCSWRPPRIAGRGDGPRCSGQIGRVEGIAARLEGFAYNSSYDRLHLMTDAERRPRDEAAVLLGGTVSEAQAR